jgi:hypothetical protein
MGVPGAPSHLRQRLARHPPQKLRSEKPPLSAHCNSWNSPNDATVQSDGRTAATRRGGQSSAGVLRGR